MTMRISNDTYRRSVVLPSNLRKSMRITERCLQLWIKCYNERGIDGITYKPRAGRPRKLSQSEVESKILPIVESAQLT
jgi:transposase